MKHLQAKEKVPLERFEHLLSKRLDALESPHETAHLQIHTGTERLLIHFAFERIRKNEYLECVQCKGRIDEQRLLENPTVLTCGNCEPTPDQD